MPNQAALTNVKNSEIMPRPITKTESDERFASTDMSSIDSIGAYTIGELDKLKDRNPIGNGRPTEVIGTLIIQYSSQPGRNKY